MIGYGIFRFFIEYLREPDAGMDFPLQFGAENAPNYLLTSLLNFSTGQILCFFMIAGGLLFIGILSVKNKKEIFTEKQPINKSTKDMRKLRKKIK
jgi:phosphatidylglycerol:prolipoprotein diacylglycerol transferase